MGHRKSRLSQEGLDIYLRANSRRPTVLLTRYGRDQQIDESRNRNSTNKPSLKFRIFWFLVCSFGLCYHLYAITTGYLKYDTNSEVIISSPLHIVPPSVSICAAPHELLKEESFPPEVMKQFQEANCDETTKIANSYQCGAFIENFYLSEIFMNKTISLVDMIFDIPKLPRNEEKLEYYMHGLKCVKLSRFKNRTIQLSAGQMDKMKPVPGKQVIAAVFQKTRRTNQTLNLHITLHDSSKLAHFREGNMLVVITDTTERNLFLLDYEDIESRLLKAPFSSNCYGYPRHGFESKSDCIEKCYEGTLRGRGIPAGFMATTDFGELNFKMKEHIFHEPDHKVDDQCTELCPNSCVRKEHFLSVLERYGIVVLKDMILILIYSTRPSTLVVMQASFSVHSFIIYAASIAGLWFGCSLFITITDILCLISSIVRKVK